MLKDNMRIRWNGTFRGCAVAVIALTFCATAHPLHAQSKENTPASSACNVVDRNQESSKPVQYHTCRKGGGRDALWLLAQDCAKDVTSDSNCVLHARRTDEEYVVVKDCDLTRKPEAYLLVPLQCVRGVDDPQIHSASFRNLWEDAWMWSMVYPGKPASRTALVINSSSPKARTQDQLHIHMTCVHKDVSDALKAGNVPLYTGIPLKPVEMKELKNGNTYYAVKVNGLTARNSPFAVVLAAGVKPEDMKHQGVAVVGSERQGEYYVLYTSVAGANYGFAEELLDQGCTDTW